MSTLISLWRHFWGWADFIMIAVILAALAFDAATEGRRLRRRRRENAERLACPWCTDKACGDADQCTCKQPCAKGYCKARIQAEIHGWLRDGEQRG